jgi:ubiquitin-like modifier-activating enzyme ATG7
MSIIQFSPLQSRPSSSFWSSLASLKLDKLKLDDSQVDITGYFERAKVVQDKAVAGQDGVGNVFVGGSLSVDADAFDESGGSR